MDKTTLVYITIFLVLYVIACIIVFSMMKVASDADDQLEEWLEEEMNKRE